MTWIELTDVPDPLAAWRSFAAAGFARPFLLESAAPPGFAGARFSCAGHSPFLSIECHGERATLSHAQGHTDDRPQRLRADPLELLRGWLKRLRTKAAAAPASPALDACPLRAGGAIACFGYDLCHFIEELPRTAVDDSQFGDLHVAFYDTVLVIDHLEQRAFITAASPFGNSAQAAQSAHAMRELLQARPDEQPYTRPAAIQPGGILECNFTRSAYQDAVARALDFIAAGDIFQVNLSQRFRCPWRGSAAELYAAVRRESPAPFAALIDLGQERYAISASPERFLRVDPPACGAHADSRRVQTRPIKGTRPRGADPREDRALARQLMASGKDAAELAMIVDLARNDLGRVCAYGSVVVTQPGKLESHPTVHHRVATVEGRLRPGAGRVDLLRAAFPGGSITGAPKIRAMEIIDELEPTCRKLYTGAIGYLGLDGSMDLNIAIRTITLEAGEARFQAGGGIVADSDPADEYAETLHKARALARALGVADQLGERPTPLLKQGAKMSRLKPANQRTGAPQSS